MKTINQTLKLTVLAASLLAIHGPAPAQDADLKQLTTPDSSISVGIGDWTKDRAQQGIYDGMEKAGVYGLIDADVSKRDNATGTWWKFDLRSFGLDTREFRGEWLRQGDIGLTLDYSRTPRVTPHTVNTGLRGFGSTTQQVSTITPGTGSDYELKTVRDNTGLKFYKNLMPGLDFTFKFTNEDKEGNRHYSRGGDPTFAVDPISSTTRQAEAILSYAGERLQLSGGYYASWYKNDNNLVSTRSGATTLFLSQPMDNQAHQLYLDGGYRFTPTTRGTLKLAYTRATQDEHLPTADITLAGSTPLAGAPTNLSGRLDTTLVQLGVTSRPVSRLSVLANVRYHHVNEKTPQARFVRTGGTNCATTATCVDNTPLSFKTLSGKVEGTYRLPQGFSVIGGIDARNQDRTVPVGAGSINVAGVDRQRFVPFRSSVDETTYRVQLRRAMSDTVNGSLAFLHSKRKGSSYTLANEDGENEINPIHVADRKRDKWRLGLDWTPAERISLQFNVEDARDKYETSRLYGLKDGKATLYSVDGSFTLNENWQLTAWFSHDDTKAKQFNGRWSRTTEEHEADRESRLSDKGDSLGFGARGNVGERFKLGADLQWTRNRSQYQQDTALTGTCGALGYCTVYPFSGRVTAVALPDITNKLTKINLFAVYALRKNADLRLDFIHEKWRTDDWTWMFANGTPFVYGSTTDGTAVIMHPHQKSNFIGARYIYKFQ